MTRLMNRLIVAATLSILVPHGAEAASARVIGMHVRPLAAAHPAEGAVPHRFEPAPLAMTATPDPVPDAVPSTIFAVYPMAGTIGKDFAVPFYVDLDSSAGTRVEGAVAAIEVIDWHDGEPDQRVDNNPTAIANYITLRHDNGRDTQYVHLRSGSVTLHRGDFVTAGVDNDRRGFDGNRHRLLFIGRGRRQQ